MQTDFLAFCDRKLGHKVLVKILRNPVEKLAPSRW